MKLTSFLSAIFFSSAALYSENIYFGNASGVFSNDSSWFLNGDLTEAGRAPSSEDTAVFASSSNVAAWVTQIDTYVGNIVSAGQSQIAFGRQIQGQEVPANFEIYGRLLACVNGSSGSSLNISTSFEDEGSASIDFRVGSIEVGTELFEGETSNSYGNVYLNILFSDPKITNSTVVVNGDIKMGGLENAGCGLMLQLGADKVQVLGILDIKRNGYGFSNVYFGKSTVLELGGLVATDPNGDFTIYNNVGSGFASEIVFKNAVGTDCQYIGAIVDDGNNRADLSAIQAVMNVTMDGDGTQRIFQAVQSKTDILGRMGGTYAAKSGRLFMDNSRIAADYRLAALSLEGGRFGAGHYDSSQTGTAYFKTADFQSGGLAYENFANHNSIETQVSDKIIVAETFSKAAGSGKISVDFSDRNGNALDLQNYAIADDVSGIESWVEILTAGSLEGFDLESKLGGNIYDANGDFYAIGIENGVAVFRWAESLEDGGYALQVGFAQVPEPAVAAAILGALALGLAARGRR